MLSPSDDRKDADWNPLSILTDEEKPSEAPTEEAAAYIVFKLCGQWLAVAVSQVREILDDQPVTPVPNAPHDVKGIIDIRGADVAIVDLAQHLGLMRQDEDDNARIVVLEFSRDDAPPLAIGVQSAAVRDVVRLSQDLITDPPEALKLRDRSLLLGVTRLDDRPLVVLDLAPLFCRGSDGVSDDAFDFS